MDDAMTLKDIDLSMIGKMSADEIIVDHIRQLVKSKKIPYDRTLPNGKQLASAWGLSYVTVQKGLNRCAREGLLLRRPGMGTIVNAGNEKVYEKNLLTRQIYVIIQQKKNENDIDFSQTFYFSRLLLGLREELMRNDILITSVIVGSEEQEKLVIRNLAKNPVDLVMLLRFSNNEFLNEIKKVTSSVILVEPHIQPEKNETLILKDEESAARSAVNYLLSKGHRRIFPAVMSNDKWITRLRYGAIRKVAKEQYIEEEPDLLAEAGFIKDPEGARARLRNLFAAQKRPFAVLVQGADIYEMLMESLKGLDLRMPEDLTVLVYTADDLAELPSAVAKIIEDAFVYGSSIGRIVHNLVYVENWKFNKPRTFSIPVGLQLNERLSRLKKF
jgi:DNA-binding LacI/PurR family transcriptional regulator